jgi:predicted nucleic acid-binding protein
MNRIYISDTNIWIDFRHAGLLNELFLLPFTLCCTNFVLHELNDFDHEALLGQGLKIEDLDGEAVERLFLLNIEHNNSSLADVSCYLLAKDTGYPLLTGDGQLRRQAQRDGLQIHGALWLLDRLVEHQIISTEQAAVGLEVMLNSGARLPPSECNARVFKWRSDLNVE